MLPLRRFASGKARELDFWFFSGTYVVIWIFWMLHVFFQAGSTELLKLYVRSWRGVVRLFDHDASVGGAVVTSARIRDRFGQANVAEAALACLISLAHLDLRPSVQFFRSGILMAVWISYVFLRWGIRRDRCRYCLDLLGRTCHGLPFWSLKHRACGRIPQIPRFNMWSMVLWRPSWTTNSSASDLRLLSSTEFTKRYHVFSAFVVFCFHNHSLPLHIFKMELFNFWKIRSTTHLYRAWEVCRSNGAGFVELMLLIVLFTRHSGTTFSVEIRIFPNDHWGGNFASVWFWMLLAAHVWVQLVGARWPVLSSNP